MQVLCGGKLAGLNCRLRCYRYDAGNVYRPHVDGAWPGSGIKDGKKPSLVSEFQSQKRQGMDAPVGYFHISLETWECLQSAKVQMINTNKSERRMQVDYSIELKQVLQQVVVQCAKPLCPPLFELIRTNQGFEVHTFNQHQATALKCSLNSLHYQQHLYMVHDAYGDRWSRLTFEAILWCMMPMETAGAASRSWVRRVAPAAP
eukprot:1160731-Pelagomonas_calceolata.AAC.3